MSTENIQKFLRPPDKGGAYTDEKLAALLAHAEDGKLAFRSCCCFIGVSTANHALKGAIPASESYYAPHYVEATFAAKRLGVAPGGLSAPEAEYLALGGGDELRRARLIPLIRAEMALREQERQLTASEAAQISEMFPRDLRYADTQAERERYQEQGVKQ